MGLFDFLKSGGDNINEVQEYLKNNPAAVLLDVREPGEYASGHIPGSKNFPVGTIREGLSSPDPKFGLESKETPVYVYCQSGMRSKKAAKILKEAGYADVHDLGGIAAYRGKKER